MPIHRTKTHEYSVLPRHLTSTNRDTPHVFFDAKEQMLLTQAHWIAFGLFHLTNWSYLPVPVIVLPFTPTGLLRVQNLWLVFQNMCVHLADKGYMGLSTQEDFSISNHDWRHLPNTWQDRNEDGSEVTIKLLPVSGFSSADFVAKLMGKKKKICASIEIEAARS